MVRFIDFRSIVETTCLMFCSSLLLCQSKNVNEDCSIAREDRKATFTFPLQYSNFILANILHHNPLRVFEIFRWTEKKYLSQHIWNKSITLRCRIVSNFFHPQATLALKYFLYLKLHSRLAQWYVAGTSFTLKHYKIWRRLKLVRYLRNVSTQPNFIPVTQNY